MLGWRLILQSPNACAPQRLIISLSLRGKVHMQYLYSQVNGGSGFFICCNAAPAFQGKKELVDRGAATLDTPQNWAAGQVGLSWVGLISLPSSLTLSPLPAVCPVESQDAATRVRQPKNRWFIFLSLLYLTEIRLLTPGLSSGCQGKQTSLPRSQLTTCCCCLNSIKIRGSAGRDTAALLLMQCQAGWELSIKSN